MSRTSEVAESTLIDELLAEQQQLTAVTRFAQWHTQAHAPAQERYYRALIPLAKPRPGEQFAFAVDLDACSGCKACVSACHSLNGLDEDEIWRSTGLLHGGTLVEPYQQVVTSACHHCVDPACLNGCPVLAYEKDPETGIVRHLDDQCIGCQYCVLKCPYDVPKYSSKRGIVRKCDLCSHRLAAHEAPACVQACPNTAIQVRVVSQAEITRLGCGAQAQLLPGTVHSSYTQPTTTYVSRRPIPENARPADIAEIRLEHAHWPLIWMLVMTQAAAGLFIVQWLLAMGAPAAFRSVQMPIACSGFALLQFGLGASFFHLGRPFGAWRAFLGWRRSWMSREILAFSGFALAVGGCVAVGWLSSPPFSPWLTGITGIAAALGMASIFCSAMIYVDTRREFWRGQMTFTKFFGTTLLLGTTAGALILSLVSVSTGAPAVATAAQAAAWAATIVRTLLFVWETATLAQGLDGTNAIQNRSAQALWMRLRHLVLARGLLFVVSTVGGLLALGEHGWTAASWAALSFLSTFASQLAERYLFFVAVDAPRMPGGVPS